MDESYKKFLAPNEKIVAVFDYATTDFISGLIIGIILAPVLLGIYIIFWNIYQKLTIKYLITNKRVIIKRGLIGQSAISADYSRITDVSVEQGIFGRLLLHSGTIFLNTAGGDTEELELKWIQNPFSVKDIIYQHLHKS